MHHAGVYSYGDMAVAPSSAPKISPYGNLPVQTPSPRRVNYTARSQPAMTRTPLSSAPPPRAMQSGGMPLPPKGGASRFTSPRKGGARASGAPLPAASFTCAACTKIEFQVPSGKCQTCAGTDAGPDAGLLCEGCFTVHSRGLMRNHVFNLPGGAAGSSRSERELLLEEIGAVALPPLTCRIHGGQPTSGLAFYCVDCRQVRAGPRLICFNTRW
jgi:hypothetical protein